MNIIVTGDHGMSEIIQNVVLENYNITGQDIYVVEMIPSLTAFVNNATNWPLVWQRLNKMPNVTVYRERDIPDKWHFKNNDRVPDLVVIPDDGVSIVCF